VTDEAGSEGRSMSRTEIVLDIEHYSERWIFARKSLDLTGRNFGWKLNIKIFRVESVRV
jgi:hypothetical protein